MSASSVVVGIDVAKAHVDVAVLGAQFVARRFDNDADGQSALAAALQPLGVALVVMEATGGYEVAVVAVLAQAGLPVVVVNPRQVRQFAWEELLLDEGRDAHLLLEPQRQAHFLQLP